MTNSETISTAADTYNEQKTEMQTDKTQTDKAQTNKTQTDNTQIDKAQKDKTQPDKAETDKSQTITAGSLIVCVGIAILRFAGKWIHIDYGIIGVLLPAFAELTGTWRGKRDRYLTLAGFSAGLLLMAINMGGIQYFGLLSVPLLLAYNGQRGNLNLKNFFYWFYPVHMAVIGLIAMLEHV